MQTNIGRLGPFSFKLGPIGTYQILFWGSVTEAGQLILTLNDEDLDYTVSGCATGRSQIVGMAIVTTIAMNSILTVRNPDGNAAAQTITPLAGETRPVSANLVMGYSDYPLRIRVPTIDYIPKQKTHTVWCVFCFGAPSGTDRTLPVLLARAEALTPST